jgi:predicted ribosome quality control (RQC) complex YloA/Tae2 family protein
MGWMQGSRTKERYIDSSTFTNEDYLEHIEDSIDVKERKILQSENRQLQEQIQELQKGLRDVLSWQEEFIPKLEKKLAKG